MNTIIGKDSVITGTIDIKGPLRVDGKVNGEVHCTDTVTVGDGGELEGEIKCKTASLSGKINGNIMASEKVELLAKSEITGDIKTKSLVIEQGAVFCGSCNMKEGTGTQNTYSSVAEKVRNDQKEPVKQK